MYGKNRSGAREIGGRAERSLDNRCDTTIAERRQGALPLFRPVCGKIEKVSEFRSLARFSIRRCDFVVIV